jgi:nicotinate-nucleotide pyrophosphorylase (carboxylating)
VEVSNEAEAEAAVEAGATFLLCDNMTTGQLRRVVAAVGDRAELEATGGITLHNARDYAATGVDFLSVGELTHSAPVLDIAMDLRPDQPPGAAPAPRPTTRRAAPQPHTPGGG